MSFTGKCAAIHPVATHTDGGIIICTLPAGHRGNEHHDTSNQHLGEIITWNRYPEGSETAALLAQGGIHDSDLVAP